MIVADHQFLNPQKPDQDLLHEPARRVAGEGLREAEEARKVEPALDQDLLFFRGCREELGRRLRPHDPEWVGMEGDEDCPAPGVFGSFTDALEYRPVATVYAVEGAHGHDGAPSVRR